MVSSTDYSSIKTMMNSNSMMSSSVKPLIFLTLKNHSIIHLSIWRTALIHWDLAMSTSFMSLTSLVPNMISIRIWVEQIKASTTINQKRQGTATRIWYVTLLASRFKQII
jgi:hypothetical protein